MNEEDIRLIILKQVQASVGTPLFVSDGNASIGITHRRLEVPQGYSFEQFCDYILQLSDEGLLKYREAGRTQAGVTGILIERLTAQGQAFLDAM